MANVADKVPENVPGRFYVDTSCLYCELCARIAPGIFKEERSRGWAYVARQPVTTEEIAAAVDALEGCPTESIGKESAWTLAHKKSLLRAKGPEGAWLTASGWVCAVCQGMGGLVAPQPVRA